MKKINSLSAMLLSLIIGIVFIVSPVSASALSISAAENYDTHEYEQLRAFMEQENAAGIKNGEQLSQNYLPDDPATWGGIRWNEPGTDGIIHVYSLSFVEDFVPGCNLTGNLEITDFSQLEYINVYDNSLTGITVSGCPIIDQVSATNNDLTLFSVTDCPMLRLLWCDENPQLEQMDISNLPAMSQLICNDTLIDSLDVSAFPNLFLLHCHNTGISALDVSCNHQLREINISNTGITGIDLSPCPFLSDFLCSNMNISQLDISNNTGLQRLFCNDTPISALDLSSNHSLEKLRCYNTLLKELDWNVPALALHIMLDSEGDGFVGVDWERAYNPDTDYFENKITAVAVPAENAEFLGWYNASSELVSTDERYFLGLDADIGNLGLTARFSEAEEPEPEIIPGDFDGDGVITVEDAIMILRAAVNLFEPAPEKFAACDFDGDGQITITDAVLTLRAAMSV